MQTLKCIHEDDQTVQAVLLTQSKGQRLWQTIAFKV